MSEVASLDDAVIIRLKTHGESYEVYVDADNALRYKSEEEVKLEEVLVVNHIFKDAKAGDKASEEHLLDLFKTKDINEVYKEILINGELHLTTEQKRKMHEERKKQVATIIARNAINPQTNTPHPLTRIEDAMEEARVEIVISRSAKEQVEKVLKALKPLIPIKFEKLQVAVHIPVSYAGRLFHILHEFGEVKKEDWKDGEQYVLIEIPAGLQDDFYAKLNGATHGGVKTKVVKHE
ncbi:MAG: ribosome assembly factor SBDS [Candidatus Altiarchaeota archaeon]|nr:ribosome assembly factor SBDS [Candidatus Altiarchaeota archaeon]